MAENAHFSGVVSPGGTETVSIDCSAACISQDECLPAIYTYMSSYFVIDGITIKNCGNSASGAVVISGNSDMDVGNSTSISNSRIIDSNGNGIYIYSAHRAIVHKVFISGASVDGIRVGR